MGCDLRTYKLQLESVHIVDRGTRSGAVCRWSGKEAGGDEMGEKTKIK